MIKSFASKLAEDIYNGVNSRQSRQFSPELHSKAQRLLDQLNAITVVETLRIPPSNRLEPVQNLARLREKPLIFENRSAAY
jgi:toxin HigB-1